MRHGSCRPISQRIPARLNIHPYCNLLRHAFYPTNQISVLSLNLPNVFLIISKLNYFCIQIFTPVTSPHLLEELNQRLKPMLSTFKDPEVKISRVVCFHHPKCGALENSIFACFFQITHLLGLSK